MQGTNRPIMLAMLTLLILIVTSPSWAMENHSDVLRDQYGRAIGGATVTVYSAGSSTLATIYSDNGTTAKANPFLTAALTGQFNFYAANGTYDLVYSYPGATFDAAHTRRIVLYDPADDEGGGGGGGGETGWPTVGDPNEITWAVDETTSAQIGDSIRKIKIWGDATNGVMFKPDPLADSMWRIWTDYKGCIRDEEAGANMWCFDPDAASKNLMYTFGTNYKPLKSAWISAGAMDGDGTNCPALSTTVTLNSGPKAPVMVCGSSADGTLDFNLVMPDAWDGGTLLFELAYIQTAADTNVLSSTIAAQCRGAGETPSSTFGTDSTINDAAVSGSNVEDHTTSGAVTPDGTCAGGDHLYGRWTLNVASTTTAEATLRILGIKMIYAVNSLSD